MALNEAIDPMGLGGVGGGFFGGDVAGSGGSTLTGLGIKDGVETTPKEEQEYWDSIRSVVENTPTQPLSFWAANFNFHQIGKSRLAAKGLKANPKGLFSKKDVLAFFEDEDEAGKNLINTLTEIMDDEDAKNLTPEQKGIVIDSFVTALAKGWSGITWGLFGAVKVDDKINKSLEKAIEGPKGYKATHNIPSFHLTPQEEWGVVYDDEDPEEAKSLKAFNVYKGYREDEKDVEDEDTNAKINNYLGKKTDIQDVMDTVAANQNKGKLFGNTQNVGYKGPVKGITTPLGQGQTFTQVQANVPTSQWSAAQHAQVGPFAGMLGLKGQGLNPSSLEPVADVSFNPSTSWGNFNTNTGLHGTAGYNTQTGAYGNIGATTTGNLFGGTFGANIGYNTNTGPTAGLNFNYSW